MAKDDMTIQFKYDHNGLRTQKIVTENGVATTTNYTLHGKLLTHMTVGNDTLHFFYDAQSRPAKVNYNGVIYTYVHNLQGDIIGILDNTGNLVVEYKYDAWGKPLNTTGSLADTLGKLNPFRYRGYVYDEESGMYYLRSRYYNPTVGRFVNADKCVVAGALVSNTYSYCKNSPALAKDDDGYFGIIGAISVIAVAICIVYSREIISDSADKFLSQKGWTLSNMLFQQALWGEGNAVTDKSYGIQTVKDLIAADPQTYDMIKDVVESMEPDTTVNYVPDKGFEYTNGDMYYALQHVTYSASITKYNDGSWNANIRIKDRYNFDSFRWKLTLGGVANNGGLFLQSAGMLTPYDIDITVTLQSQ